MTKRFRVNIPQTTKVGDVMCLELTRELWDKHYDPATSSMVIEVEAVANGKFESDRLYVEKMVTAEKAA